MGKPLGQFIVSGVLLTAMSPAFAEAYGSGWYGEIQASYGHEDNISRTYKSDEVTDEVASISVGGGHSRKIGNNAQLILSGYLIYNKHDEYDALDTFAVSLEADYTIQPTAAYDSPWYNLKVNATNLEYRDSDPREGVLVNLELSVNKRLRPRLTGHLGYRYRDLIFVNKSSKEEEHDAAFDTDAHELYLGMDYQMSQSIFLFGEYSYRHGDVRSTVSGGLSDTAEYDADTIDPVFDDPCVRRCTFSYAYRTRGDTQVGTLGIAFPYKTVNFDLATSYYRAESDHGRVYKDWLVKFGALWNF